MKDNFMQPKERIAFNLEQMYHNFGYEKYKINKFEKYTFYLENEKFLNDNRVLTFYDPTGKLLALKPDVTMSIVKSCLKSKEVNHKIYYNESVFRVPFGSEEFKEIQQIGVEYFGNYDLYQTIEILNLALKSLSNINDNYILSLSNVAVLLTFFDELKLKLNEQNTIIEFMQQKNIHDLKKYMEEKCIQDKGILSELIGLTQNPKEAIITLKKLFPENKYSKEINVLEEIVNILLEIIPNEKGKVVIDFSQISNTKYYNQLVFVGYCDGFVNPVLTGGRYDNLASRMGLLRECALGFAVDLSVINSSNLEKNIEVISYNDNDNVLELIKKSNELFGKGEKFSVIKK